VRRDVGGHADGDAGAAVDEEVGDAGGEDRGLERGLVVVGAKSTVSESISASISPAMRVRRLSV